jgi:hypothetical protein
MRTLRRNVGGWKALEWGDIVVLVDQSNQDQPPVYDVSWDGGVPLFGSDGTNDSTGLITIWAVTTPPLPYVLDSKAATGAIAANGGTKTCTPNSLSVGANELIQARIKIRLIDTASPSGAVIDDFSLLAYLPGSQAVWGTSLVGGVLSARRQIADGADAISAPTQGTNQLLPASRQSVSGWESADSTELWWFGVNSNPQFKLVYMGSGATPAGIAIALEVSGYRYLLTEHPPGHRVVTRGGVKILVPDDCDVDDIIGIPTTGRAATTT